MLSFGYNFDNDALYAHLFSWHTRIFWLSLFLYLSSSNNVMLSISSPWPSLCNRTNIFGEANSSKVTYWAVSQLSLCSNMHSCGNAASRLPTRVLDLGSRLLGQFQLSGRSVSTSRSGRQLSMHAWATAGKLLKSRPNISTIREYQNTILQRLQCP